jgi:hypothetical protein
MERMMFVLMKVAFGQEKFNEAARDGTVGAKLKRILAEMKPEAAYFAEFEGKRTGIFVVNLEDASKIPALAEPWFLQFDTEVELHPAMVPEDLGKAGLEELAKKWG